MRNEAEQELEKKVDSIISSMTMSQKVAQLQGTHVMGDDPALMLNHLSNGVGEVVCFTVSRSPAEVAAYNQKVVEAVCSSTPQKIPPLIHVEALTGLNSIGGTVFPSAIGLGATFSADNVEKMADIIRQQMISVGFRQALSPVMDVARDPRWGRIGETYGEDPTLVAEMSVAFTKGIQGDDLETGVIATAKHFLGYPCCEGGLNMTTNPIPPRELREVYAKPFQAAISKSNLQSIMNSYGTIDNEVIIGSRHILTELLRDEMKFEGMVVSDYMAVDWLVHDGICTDMEAAGREALIAGLDVELPTPKGFTGELMEAVKMGTLSEEYINQAVKRVLVRKYKLGLFDNPNVQMDKIESAYFVPKNMEHSKKCALESIVLLKNDGILPLSKESKKIAVIGPHADSIRLLFGGYTFPATIDMSMSGAFGDMAGMDGLGISGSSAQGFVPEDYFPDSKIRRERKDVQARLQQVFGKVTPTILASIKEKCPEATVEYAHGCDIAGTDRSGFAKAIEIAQEADVVIMTLGGKYGWGDNCTIGEGLDSDKIGLPGIQEDLAKEIFATGTRAICVHMDARPLSSPFIVENYSAILENWFPGTTGGSALADVLFGDYNPGGRLPVTVARNAGQIPIYVGQKKGNSYNSMLLEEKLCKYVEGTVEPLFYFGEGKSYTSFEYSDFVMDSKPDEDGNVFVSCTIKNIGKMDGDEVVQLYVSDLEASMLRPEKEFAGCCRIFLLAGESKKVSFKINETQFAFLNKEMQWVIEEGDMAVMIGSSSIDMQFKSTFKIQKTRIIEGYTREFYATVL